MKKTLLSIALAAVAPLAFAQTSSTTTTTTSTTTVTGTITEFTSGSTIVLKESSGPRHYRFGNKVVYVTKSGKELGRRRQDSRPRWSASARGVPGEGDAMTVNRVVLDED